MADGWVGDVLDRIDRARGAILDQIAERDEYYPEGAPAPPWHTVVSAQRYVLNLPAEDLRSIRLHCDLFLGENTPLQIFGGNASAADYRWFGEGVPVEDWASEPVIPSIGIAIGAEVDSKRVTLTTALIQRYLCNLIRLGLRDGQHIVEIGAGYGGLAEAVLRARNVRYTIIDLPETLIFSAAFLIHHFPEKRVYIYKPGDTPDMMEGADLVFLPNYRADWVQPMDIAINTVSFPEMSRDALIDYIDLIADRLLPDGFLMSVNYEINPTRYHAAPVSAELARRFDVSPPPGEGDVRDINNRPTRICVRRGGRFPDGVVRDVVNGERQAHAVTSPVTPA